MAFQKLHTCGTNTYIIKKGMGCGFRWVGGHQRESRFGCKVSWEASSKSAPFLVDEHVKHILLLSPAPKRLTKRTLLLLLEVVTYLPTCHSSSLHLQNPHIQKLDNLQARMTWNRRKSKKKHLKHGKWDTQPGKERGKKKKKNLKSR